MNAVAAAPARPLLDMLGARWRVLVPANAVAWERFGAFAGFALDDGTLALVPASWDGRPGLRLRDGGGAELIPAIEPAPPAARARAHRGRCLSVAADPDSGFLTGGSDGRIMRVATDGQTGAIAHLDGAAEKLAAGRAGWRVCAIRQSVHRLGGSTSRIDVAGPVTALAVEPGGARVAVGHANGVTLWAGGLAPRTVEMPGTPVELAWSADGAWLGACSEDGELFAWHERNAAPITFRTDGPVRALVPVDNIFAISVSGRVYCWDPGAVGLVTCGVANQIPLTRLAGHPKRRLIAAGYANGAVVLCQPDTSELLFVRAVGEGSVSALMFSFDGDNLAIGTDGGDIGVVALPDALFRNSTRSQ